MCVRREIILKGEGKQELSIYRFNCPSKICQLSEMTWKFGQNRISAKHGYQSQSNSTDGKNQ